MVRAKLWLQCAAVFDPVSPVLVQPAIIGWEGKNRRIDLTIERPFQGEELLQRMKGWVTADPREVIAAVKPEGFLKVNDRGALMVEADANDQLERIQARLREKFGYRVYLEFAES